VKQCVVYDDFDDKSPAGNQGNLKEFAKTYKMNAFLRHKLPSASGPWAGSPLKQQSSTCAKITECKGSQDWVLLGDGMSLDVFGPIPDQVDSGRFSMQVNQVNGPDAWPALRHGGGANILFVDGHAATIVLSTVDPVAPRDSKTDPINKRWKLWQSEWADANGNEKFPIDDADLKPMCEQGPEKYNGGYYRNPKMPLKWSDPARWISR
jgi:prepilin-type processing-associated H-X9-DG protein